MRLAADTLDTLETETEVPVLVGPRVPEPVFFCSVEAPSPSKEKVLEAALLKLQREDPSLRVNLEEDSGQIILSGMGELHLEVCLNHYGA